MHLPAGPAVPTSTGARYAHASPAPRRVDIALTMRRHVDLQRVIAAACRPSD